MPTFVWDSNSWFQTVTTPAEFAVGVKLIEVQNFWPLEQTLEQMLDANCASFIRRYSAEDVGSADAAEAARLASQANKFVAMEQVMDGGPHPSFGWRREHHGDGIKLREFLGQEYGSQDPLPSRGFPLKKGSGRVPAAVSKAAS